MAVPAIYNSILKNLNLIKNLEDIVVFYRKVFHLKFLHCFLQTINPYNIFAENPQMKTNSLKKQKHVYLNHI